MSEDGRLRLKLGIAMILGGSFIAGCCGGLGADGGCVTCGDEQGGCSAPEGIDAGHDAALDSGAGGASGG